MHNEDQTLIVADKLAVDTPPNKMDDKVWSTYVESAQYTYQ